LAGAASPPDVLLVALSVDPDDSLELAVSGFDSVPVPFAPRFFEP
jgi:hypothetical protein